MDTNLYDNLLVVIGFAATVTGLIFAVLIYFQQLRVEKTKVNISLYHKRYAIYESFMCFYSFVTTTGGMTEAAIFEFSRKTRNMFFLFGKNGEKYRDIVMNHANELKYCCAIIRANNDKNHPQLNFEEVVQQYSLLIKWFDKEFRRCQKQEFFNKYLQTTL